MTQTFNHEWKSEQLKFSDIVGQKYALIQTQAGPSGMLSILQSYILLELVSNYDKPTKDVNLL